MCQPSLRTTRVLQLQHGSGQWVKEIGITANPLFTKYIAKSNRRCGGRLTWSVEPKSNWPEENFFRSPSVFREKFFPPPYPDGGLRPSRWPHIWFGLPCRGCPRGNYFSLFSSTHAVPALVAAGRQIATEARLLQMRARMAHL